MPKLWESENELATAFADTLRERGFTVYPEISADLLIRTPDGLEAVEAKLAPNLKVLCQAIRHRGKFPMISILIPSRFKDKDYAYFVSILAELGIGLWVGSKRVLGERCTYLFTQVLKPVARDVVIDPDLEAILTPEAERWTTPGKPSPSGFSKYRQKELKLARYFRDNPGTTVEEALRVCYPRTHKRTGAILQPRKTDIELWRWFMSKSKFVSTTDGLCYATEELTKFD